MGSEIKRDQCPEKYCSKGSIIKDSLSTLVACIIVAIFSGNMFSASGLVNIVVVILIEAVFVFLLYGLIYFLLKGMKARLAETYISVCENGVCGICPMTGFKNKSFELPYDAITKMVVKGERLFLYSKDGTVPLTLTDAAGIAQLIKSKNPNL